MKHMDKLPDMISGFYISISEKKQIRRLHCAGACWRIPGRDYMQYAALGDEVPDETSYDVKCRDCWRGQAVRATGAASSTDAMKEGKELESGSGGESSSESSSSSSGELDVRCL